MAIDSRLESRLGFRCVLFLMVISTFVAINFEGFDPSEFSASGILGLFAFALGIAIALPLETIFSAVQDVRTKSISLDFYDKGFVVILGVCAVLAAIIGTFGISMDTINILLFLSAFEAFNALVLGIFWRGKMRGLEDGGS